MSDNALVVFTNKSRERIPLKAVHRTGSSCPAP